MPTGLYPVPRGLSWNHRLVSEQRLVAVNLSNPPSLGLSLSLFSDGVRGRRQQHCGGGCEGLGEIPDPGSLAGWSPWQAGWSRHHSGQAAEGGAVWGEPLGM